MHRASDIVERLLADIPAADTAWLVRIHPDELEMITVGGYYTDHTRRRIPRGDTVTDLILASGQDVMLLTDVWSRFLRRETRVAALAANAQSCVSAVIRVDGAPWGLVSVTSSRTPCPFTDEHAKLILEAAVEIAGRIQPADPDTFPRDVPSQQTAASEASTP